MPVVSVNFHGTPTPVWQEMRIEGPYRAAMVRHPTHPYCIVVSNLEDATLHAKASKYLNAIKDALELPKEWLEKLADDGFAVNWLPVRWGAKQYDGKQSDPRLSFIVQRQGTSAGEAAEVIDRTIVLLASNTVEHNGAKCAIGDEAGLRIVMHVREPSPGKYVLRFTGASLSASLLVPVPAIDDECMRCGSFESMEEKLKDSYRVPELTLIGARQMEEGDWRLRLSAIPGAQQGDVFGCSPTGFGRAGSAYDIEVCWRHGEVEILRACERTARARDDLAPPDRVLLRDPVSSMGAYWSARVSKRRRTDSHLLRFRAQIALDDFSTEVGKKKRALEETKWFKVIEPQPALSRRTQRSPRSTGEVISQESSYSLRSRAVASVHAAMHASNLFHRMAAYGLEPTHYFKFAKLPLLIDPVARMSSGHGRSGKTVNAEVRYFPNWPHFWEIDIVHKRPSLYVNFALGDLSRRMRSRVDHEGKDRGRPGRAEYLGIACDPHWAWHEFGHVLIAAATGDMELRFSHSVGDALAAIVCDPYSKLARRQRYRYATFPWIGGTRRHDRDVNAGWSWCGSFHRATRVPREHRRCNSKAYLSEQILSTTLFRLYRSIGGDTMKGAAPDYARRQEASDYCVYLIMRALALLGPVGVVPAETPDQFVSALIDADIGTEEWRLESDWPFFNGEVRSCNKTGGFSHKVVRWAFEAQGLYAKDERTVVNGPGEPPAVDIYIEDRRQEGTSEIHAPGTYTPVSLDWGNSNALEPYWSASDDAVSYDRKAGRVKIKVRNRGIARATEVRVRLWWFDLPADCSAAELSTCRFEPQAKRARLTWHAETTGQKTSPSAVPAITIPARESTKMLQNVAGGKERYADFLVPERDKGNRLLLLVEASSLEDRANTDERTDFACSRLPSLLSELVACDNNLALRILNV